jgi:hypothetical protein
MSSPARRVGRKSKVEELDLLKQKQAFLKKLPPLGSRATESSCQDYTAQISKAYVEGLLSGAELEALQKSVALVLRALRQRHQSGEIEELEALLTAAKTVKAKAKSKATAERDRTR